MTRYEQITADMTFRKMAEMRTHSATEMWPGTDVCSMVYVNDTGTHDIYDDAITDEMAWLEQEADI